MVPHFADFRGRIYPYPQDLTPQADDASRALLQFAEGHELGDRGLYWLAVALAIAYGQDKLSLDDRVEWVRQHDALILDSARDPLDGQRFWAALDADGSPVTDAPWCFLSLCREWHNAAMWDVRHISHAPINLDGSVNGI